MTGAELHCYEDPVWGGAAPAPPKTRFPRRTLGNEKSAGIPTCGFISFHNLSRPDEGAIGPNPRNPMHLPRGLQVSVIPGKRC